MSDETPIAGAIPPPPELKGSGYAVSDQSLLLPTSLRQALELFDASDVARDALGGEFVDHYATLVRHEMSDFEAAVTDWELQRYLRYS